MRTAGNLRALTKTTAGNSSTELNAALLCSFSRIVLRSGMHKQCSDGVQATPDAACVRCARRWSCGGRRQRLADALAEATLRKRCASSSLPHTHNTLSLRACLVHVCPERRADSDQELDRVLLHCERSLEQRGAAILCERRARSAAERCMTRPHPEAHPVVARGGDVGAAFDQYLDGFDVAIGRGQLDRSPSANLRVRSGASASLSAANAS